MFAYGAGSVRGRIGTAVAALLGAALLLLAPVRDAMRDRTLGPFTLTALEAGAETNQLVVTLSDGSLSDGISGGGRLSGPTPAARIRSLGDWLGEPLQLQRVLWDSQYVVRMERALSYADAARLGARLARHSAVRRVEVDRRIWPQRVPNDALYPQQWSLFETAGGIDAPSAWDITTGSASLVIAVLDTGILASHPDLAGRVLPGYDFISVASFANDGNGRDADASDPGNWTAAGECGPGSPATRSTWHGTHVAGVIAASSDNATGIAGLNWNARILPVRVSGKCGGFMSDLAAAVRWSVGQSIGGVSLNPTPARVLNMSLSGLGACPVVLQGAIDAAIASGAVVITGSGNEGGDVAAYSPANCTGLVTAGATTRAGGLAPYSNRGPRVDLSAPGGANSAADSILSTRNNGTTTPGSDVYDAFQGTSVASAAVSGVASLMLSANPAVSPVKLKSLLVSTARAFPDASCTTATCGAGIVDAAAALRAVTTAPVVSAGADRAATAFAAVSVTGSATDDGASLTYAWSQVSGPAVALGGANSATVSFTAPDAPATVVLRLTVTDDVALSASDEVTISVNFPNRPPVPTAPGISTAEDTTGSSQVQPNDPDSGDTHTYQLTTPPAQGVASVSASGLATYVPPLNFTGSTSFAVTVRDAAGASAAVTIPVTVGAVNDAPLASDGSLSTSEDTLFDGVLVATDPDADALTWSIVAQGSKGVATVTNAATGAFRYVPTANATGADSFTFRVSDGTASSNVATVTVSIAAVNDAPVSVAGALSTNEDTLVNGTLGGSDVDGDALTFSIVAQGSKGVATVTNAATGAVRYTPNANAVGSDSFSFRVRDGTVDSAVATVTVSIAAVNDAPAAADGTLAVVEDVAVNGSFVATDVDGDALTYLLVTNGSKGTATLLDAATGAFRYTPNANATGSDTLMFRVTDGTVSSGVGIVTVTITASNDAPVAVGGALAVSEDTPATGALAATDADGDPLTYSLVAAPTRGTVVILDAASGAYRYTPTANASGADSFSFLAGDGRLNSNVAVVAVTIAAVNDAPVAADGSLAVTEDQAATGTLGGSDVDGDALTFALVGGGSKGTAVILDAATGAYRYLPNPNATGADTITFRVGDGTATSNLATIAISIAAANDAPVAGALELATNEDTAVNGTLPASDADGDTLGFALVAQGTKGTAVLLDARTGAVRYTPNADATGTDRFTFLASDGTASSAVATVTVNIAAVNDLPVAAAGSLALDEDTVATGTLVATDVDGDPLSFALAAAPSRGTVVITNAATGAYRYTPNADATGADSFSFVANDGTANSAPASVAVTIRAANDAPVAQGGTLSVVEDGTATGVLVASDADGDALSFAVVGAASRGTVTILDAATGAYRYVPNADANGVDSFSFRASDAGAASNLATVTVTISAVNDPPVVTGASVTLAEDGVLEGVLAGSDPDGGALTFSVVGNGARGVLVLLDAATGAWRYTPNANANGADAVTFRVSDGTLQSAVATLAITITPVNDAPTAAALAVSTAEDTALDGTLAGSDVDGDALSHSIATPATRGTVVILDAATGAFRYTPNANVTGVDSFTYRVRDAALNSAPATVTVTIGGANDAPVAQTGVLALDEDTVATGVLAATDADGDALSYALGVAPTQGTVVLLDAATGAYRYTPRANANGADSFGFVANDGTANSAPATIAVTIRAVNDAPVAQAGSLAVSEDTAATGTLAASDADGEALVFSLAGAPAKGTVVILDAATGAYRYTPNANATGADAFGFRVSDGTVAATATIAVTITAANDAPVASDATLAATEDTLVNGTLVGTDADGDALTFSVVAQGTLGTLVFTNPATGAFRYVPAPNANGADVVRFRVNDGTTDSNVATLTISIAAVNDAPTAAALAIATTEDTPVTGTLPGSDPDGGAIGFGLVTQGSRGTVVLLDANSGAFRYTPNANSSGTDSFTFLVSDGTENSAPATVTVTISGTNDAPRTTGGALSVDEDASAMGVMAGSDADGDALGFALVTGPTKGAVVILNAATGAYRYTPNGDANGSDSFTFRASDGQADSNVSAVAISIAPVNDAPESSALELALGEGGVANGVLPGRDVDGDALGFAIVAQGTKGTAVVLDANTGAVRYTGNPNASGTDTFTYLVSDGTLRSAVATVTVTIDPRNDPPVASGGALVLDEDTVATGRLLATDPDGDALTVAVVAGPSMGRVTITDAATGAYRYSPDPDASGTDRFEFRASDGTLESALATVTVTVRPVNDAPVAQGAALAVDEDVAASGVLVARDAEGDALEFALVTLPSRGTVTILNAATGAYRYQPNANAGGADSFSFRARDADAASAPATVTVTIAAANDAPVVTDATLTLDEDTVAGGTLAASDADGDAVTFAVTTPGTLGTLVFTDAAAGTWRYTPRPDASGTERIGFRADDGRAGSNVGTLTIVIAAVNDAPVAADLTIATPEDTAVELTLVGTDVDGDTLGYALVAQGTMGTAVLLDARRGTVRYTPNANASGLDRFTYLVSDGVAPSAVRTVTVDIGRRNDAPVAADGLLGLDEDTVATGTLAATDPDGDPVSFAILRAPARGTLTLLDAATGAYRYVPAADAQGADSFTFRASDGVANSAPATVSITIRGVNDAPLARDATLATAEDTALTGTLGASDADGDALSFVLLRLPARGTLTLLDAASGAFRYVPAADATGLESFTFRAGDGVANSAPATVTIDVRAGNDAPVATAGTLAVEEDRVTAGTLQGSDPDGGALVFALVETGRLGTATLVDPATGAYRYAPAADATGTDTLSFRVNDGTANSALATVVVTIAPANDVPVAQDLALAGSEDTAVTGTLPATDADGDTLGFALVANGAKGTAVITDVNTGAFRYVPAPNATGVDRFTFLASDGRASSGVATVTVTIAGRNDAPVAVAQALVLDEDTVLSGQLAASDADGDALTFAIVSRPARGTLLLTDPATGAFRYTPAADAHGDERFEFRAADGSANSAPAVVTLTIRPVNDAPAALGANLLTGEDTPLTGTLAATDADGDALRFEVASAPGAGTVTILDVATGAFRYVPNANATGTDRFEFRATDPAGAVGVATIAVTVRAGNDAPVVQGAVRSTPEDTPFEGRLVATDADGDPVRFSLVAAPTRGTVVLLDASAGTYRYVPQADSSGSDAFSFRADDGVAQSAPATVSINLTPINDPPVAADGALAVREDLAAEGVLVATDVDGDALSFAIVAAPAGGTLTLLDATTGAFRYQPAANATGEERFSFRASDGRTGSNVASVVLTIGGNNDPPTAAVTAVSTDEDVAVDGRLSATDPDGDALTYSIVAAPSRGSVTLLDARTGAFRYLPRADLSGPDSFSFRVSDGLTTSAPAPVSVLVRPVNDAPTAAPFGAVTDEDVPVQITLPGGDVDGDALTFTIVGAPARGTLRLVDAARGVVLYMPAANAWGSESFTYRVSDGRASSPTATVGIGLRPVDDAPLALDFTAPALEDTVLGGRLVATEVDGQPLTFAVVRGATRGRFELLDARSGEFRYTPDPDAFGDDTVLFAASDGRLASRTATLTLQVAPVDEPPMGARLLAQTNEDVPVNVTLPTRDADGDALTWRIVQQGARGSAEIVSQGGGILRYVPQADASGTDELRLVANDGRRDAAPSLLLVTVTEVNDPPRLTAGRHVGTLGRTLTGAFDAVDSEGDALRFSVATPARAGRVSFEDATVPRFTYLSDRLDVTGDEFVIAAVDSRGATATLVVAVTLEPRTAAQAAAEDDTRRGGGGALEFALLLALAGAWLMRLNLEIVGKHYSLLQFLMVRFSKSLSCLPLQTVARELLCIPVAGREGTPARACTKTELM